MGPSGEELLLAISRTVYTEAYDSYLMGLYYLEDLELDPDNADSHFVNGLATFLTGWDWEKAETVYLKGFAANPRFIEILQKMNLPLQKKLSSVETLIKMIRSFFGKDFLKKD